MMLKPIQLYIRKQKAKLQKSDLPLPTSAEFKQEWDKLKSKKIKKFVKKAEKLFDQYIEDNPNLTQIPEFNILLTKRELEILLKSYGMPEKAPCNTKQYFIKTEVQKAVSQLEDASPEEITEATENAKKEAETQWPQLPPVKRNDLLRQYLDFMKSYNESYLDFAKQLPRNRYPEFNAFELPGLKNAHSSTASDEKAIEKETEKVIRAKKNQVKELFTPFEIFFAKHQKEFADQKSIFFAKTKARVKYSGYSDKKKLKFIKEAESIFDGSELRKEVLEDDQEQIFANYLTKNELKLLLESYGMPESVSNISAYFMKIHIGEFQGHSPNVRMQKVSEKYKLLSPKEKVKLNEEHEQKQNEYSKQLAIFLQTLPPQRLADYKFFTSKHKNKVNEESRKSVNKPVAQVILVE